MSEGGKEGRKAGREGRKEGRKGRKKRKTNIEGKGTISRAHGATQFCVVFDH